MKKVFSSLMLGLTIIFAYGQSAGPQPSMDDTQSSPYGNLQLNQRDSLERWEERVYMHTDREQFVPGEHIFFKAYVVNRKTQQRWSPSGVLKLELRDTENKVVDKQYHALNNGVSEGAFELPDKVDEGSYQLLAYTRWMQNYGEAAFFSKNIQIGSLERLESQQEVAVLDKIAFFPEGGKLLSGVPNRMVIYGTSLSGDPIPFEAIITDDASNDNIPVSAYGKGMSQVTFTPMANKSYVLRLNDGRQFPLPEVQTSGYTLKINNLDPQEVFVQSEKKGITKEEKIFVQGWIDDKPCFENELSYNEEGIAKLEVSKSGLPTGKIDFRLVDESGLKLAERPVWVTLPEQLDIQIEKVASRKGKQDQHTFKVTVKDRNGQPVQTDLSMSVKAITGNMLGNTFRNGRSERFLQDLEVLSKAEIQSAGENYPDQIVYPIQKGLEIIGYAYDLNNELLLNKDIQLLGVSDSLWIAREVQTDATGLLRIQDLDFEGDTQIIFRAKGDDTRERLVKLVPLSETTLKRRENKAKKAKKLKNLVLETTPWQPIDTTGLIELEPATVTGTQKKKQEFSSQYQSMISQQDIKVQDPERPRSLLQLINELPGVNVVGIGSPNPRIQIYRRGGATAGPPLWVLDGIPLNQSTNPQSPSSLFIDTAVGLVSDLAIDRVEFLFGAPAAMFGTRGAGGVFLVYTRDGADSDYIRRKDGQLKFKGFTPSPDISRLLKEQLRKSKRSNSTTETLFWNPDLKTDEDGQVLVQVTSPEDFEQLELHVESITARGLRGTQKQLFSVNR